jgi:hypothetical protein
MSSADDFIWSLRETKTTAIMAASSSTVLPNPLVTEPNHFSYFFELAMCLPEGQTKEYLVFGKGGVLSPSVSTVSMDQIAFLECGAPWTSAQIINAASLASSGNTFAINSIAVSVASGGMLTLSSTPSQARAKAAAKLRAAQASGTKSEGEKD